MGKTLIVAEKPSVARDIAQVLGVNGKGEGCLTSDEYTVTWALGHLARLAEPDELDAANKKWTLAQLPLLPARWEIKPIPKTRAQLSVIKRLMKDRAVDCVVCATDAGREGELIFRWIYELAGCTKPCKRLWISSMTAEAIREGMQNLRPAAEFDALYASALCRARADWLIGMNLTRACTVKYQALLSVGRVQTPTLALLVRRKREIDGFLPETTYGVEADFGDYTGVYAQQGKEKQFANREDAVAIARAVAGKTGTVTRSEREPFREPPPQLYDLTTLQREANKRYGLTAKRTLAAAQTLYEKHKAITYPRTESRYLTFDVKPKVRQALESLPPPYRAYAEQATQNVAAMAAGRVFRKELDADHHAIIPTGKAIVPEKLGVEERKVMELICARFVAAFLPAAEGEKRTVITRVNNADFLSQSTQVLQPGWRAVDGLPATKTPPLPSLAVGDARRVVAAADKTHVTEPPKPYTDATLLYAMEHAGKQVEDEQLAAAMKKHGLGTPATRAAILERLLDVGYAERSKKALLPTEKGIRFIDLVPETLASAELTGQWEYGLHEIAQRKPVDDAFVQRFMTGVTRLTTEMVAAVKADERTGNVPREAPPKSKRRRAAPGLGLACPVCGKGKVTENERAFGCSRWKQGCGFTLWKDCLARHGGPTLTAPIVTALLRTGQVRGSTGTVILTGKMLRFQFRDSVDATPPINIERAK